MQNIYYLLTWGTFWLMLLSAIFLLTVAVPNRQDLKSYKQMRYLLALGIFLFMAIANFIELTTDESGIWDSRIITLWIGCCLAPLFTIINITLINPHFLTIKKIIKPLILPLLFTGINFGILVRFTARSQFFMAAYTAFVTYYVFIVIKYTLLFLKNYKEYGIRHNNYYSDPGAYHLKWVIVTQFIATGSGLMALVNLFMPAWGMCLFALFLNIFYPYYAIRFINYAFHFPTIAQVMDEIQMEPVNNEQTFQIETAVKGWEGQKMFLQSNLTIEVVARELGTNRTYLSTYLNTTKGKNFREWISDLRIIEAQQLLIAEPEALVNDIGLRVGFSDKGNFSNKFTQSTGVSPSIWRKTHLRYKQTETAC